MANNEKIKEDILFIKNAFKEMHNKTERFSKDRDFIMSNPQLFTFLYNAPACLAIAGDGTVDLIEIAIIEKLARSIDVNKTVNLNLQEMMSIASEPENCMTNEEFNLRVGSELLYLSRNMGKYERNFIEGVQTLLNFDKHPEKDGSLSSTLEKLMDFVIEHNAGKNKEKELQKINEYKKRLGLK